MAAWDPGTSFVNQDVTTGQGRVSAASRTRSNSAFVPEMWEDETIAAYKANQVLKPLVNVMDHNKKKGDTVHVPRPVRGAASQKGTQGSVTLIANQEGKTFYTIDQHWEYSRLIEDIVTIQANDSVRRFYTDDAGYALAQRQDIALHAQAAFLNAAAIGTETDPRENAASAYDGAVIGTVSGGSLVQWDPTASANAGNAAALTDDGVRKSIQALDDNDVPMMGRCLVIPPVEKYNLTGIDRFTENQFVGERGPGNTIRNGRIGNLYDVEVYVSTNCPFVADAGATEDQRACLMFQKEALLMIDQLRPRSQEQYKLEYLSHLYVSDMLFGTGVLRAEAGLAIIVPA